MELLTIQFDVLGSYEWLSARLIKSSTEKNLLGTYKLVLGVRQ